MKAADGTPSAVSALELSVVIATRSRSDLLQRCLEALGRQTQDPTTFEVVVIDDGSTDGTAELLQTVGMPFPLRTLRLARRGRFAALNAGLQTARGRVCVFLDDDVRASPELLAAHAAAHANAGRIIGIGSLTQEPPVPGDWYARAFATAWNRHYDRLASRATRWIDSYSGNLSVARDALLELGGFAEDAPVGEDSELAFRLSQRGYRPEYVPGAHGTRAGQKRRAALLADAERQGAAYVSLADRNRAMLPTLLGWFGATTSREILLRRLLLAARIPSTALALLGPVIPGRGRQEIWFEFVSRFTFWRGVSRSVTRRRWRQLTLGIPVLMYHAFDARAEAQRFVVSKRSFRRQLRVLAALRYQVIPLEVLVRALREHEFLPPRAVVITIDDGYRDVLTVAAHALRDRRYRATVFLVAARLGGRNDWDPSGELAGRALLSVDEISQLREGGFQFGAHTRNHPRLSEAPDDAIQPEIAGSRADLERELGTSVPVFTYPHGKYDERVLAATRDAYEGACTTEPRLVRLDDDPYLIPRLEIHGTDSLLRFILKLSFGGG